ncbi:TIR domain-containing protein [Limnohabitans sp. DCL3]|uniref:TIR domain-containing protein n=1 Tax=Limnohabitans sp. DCL3 TaxID=3374103 RepID=UPI003A86F18A
MTKRVFFSFHYKDVAELRANVVRNSWLTKPDRQAAGFFDASIWEEAKKQSELALKRLINGGVDGTTNTCVLVGSETYARPWVRYEIFKSLLRGNHLLAVHINSIKGKDQLTKSLGHNPFDHLGIRFAADGKTGELIEWKEKTWVPYMQIDGKAVHDVKAPSGYAGKSVKLNDLYKIYDWVGDDGYNKFSNWLV